MSKKRCRSIYGPCCAVGHRALVQLALEPLSREPQRETLQTGRFSVTRGTRLFVE